MKKNEAFNPMKTIGDYLAGKPVPKEQKEIIRKVFFKLLFMHWRGLDDRLPELAISKEIPLMRLPFLSDWEKRDWAMMFTDTEFSYTGPESPRFCRRAGKVFLRGFGHAKEQEPGERDPQIITVEGEVVATVGDLDDYLRQEQWGYSTDFEILRICILLYRSRSEWTAEELAIMREGGMRVAEKAFGRRFYRPDW